MTMPLDVAAFRKQGVELPIRFWGETITLVYDPLTIGDPSKRDERAKEYADMLTEIRGRRDVDADEMPNEDPDIEVQKEPDRLTWAEVDRPIVTMACAMLKGWDITNDGKAVPVSVDAFQEFGFPPSLARAIIRAINEDVSDLGNRNGSAPTANG